MSSYRQKAAKLFVRQKISSLVKNGQSSSQYNQVWQRTFINTVSWTTVRKQNLLYSQLCKKRDSRSAVSKSETLLQEFILDLSTFIDDEEPLCSSSSSGKNVRTTIVRFILYPSKNPGISTTLRFKIRIAVLFSKYIFGMKERMSS